MTNTSIEQLSILEQNLSSFINQKHAYKRQVLEIENALSELEGKDTAYQIVGSVMVKKDSTELQQDLSEKKEACLIKITALEKQESSLRKQVESLQNDVMKELKKGDSHE